MSPIMNTSVSIESQPEPVNNNQSNMRDDCTPMSILHTMQTFVKAVNEMDDTILIPSRLRDMDPPPQTPASMPKKPVRHNSGSSMSSSKSSSSDEDDMVLMDEVKSDALAIPESTGTSKDLFAYYQMLNAVKSELVQGPSDSESDGEEENEGEKDKDEQSAQVAKAFRHHLKGLFGVLKHLTVSAKVLTSRYQEEIGEVSTSPGTLTPFTL